MTKNYIHQCAIGRRYRPNEDQSDRGDDRHDCRDRLIDRLADLMREMAFAGENVTVETLAQRLDCAPRLITPFARKAVDLARRRSIRRISLL